MAVTFDTKQLLANVRKSLETGGGGMSKTYKFTVGQTVLRLVPFVSNGQAQIVASSAEHWLPGKDGKDRPVGCVGNDCPICAKITDKDDSRRCKVTHFFNGMFKTADGPQMHVFKLPEGAGRDLLDEIQANGVKVLEHDITITTTGDGKSRRYKPRVSINPSQMKVEGTPEDLTKRITKTLTMEEAQEIAKELC